MIFYKSMEKLSKSGATKKYLRMIYLIMADFTDVPLREDQREYLCKVADG